MYESFLAAIHKSTEWINGFFLQYLGHFWHHASFKLNYEDSVAGVRAALNWEQKKYF